MTTAPAEPRFWMSEEYRAFFEAAPDGILVVDENGVIDDANPMAGRLFGYGRDDLVGHSVEMLVPEGAREAHSEHRRGYTRSPHTRPMGVGMDLRGRRRDGSEFPVEISLSPWRSETGTKVIVAVRDVTQRTRLRDFGAGALRASEDERQRISRELHDGTAQRLATLLLRLRLVEKNVSDETVLAGLHDLRQDIAEIADETRRIARGLRPPELADAGLVAALQAHARSVREGARIDLRLDTDPIDGLLSPDSCLVLYRVVQEAISNAVRHADPTRITVTVSRRDSRIVAVVADDGRGFVLDEDGRSGGGLGLLGMQERAAMAGGRVAVESTPGTGTVVTLVVPISADVR